MRSCPWKRRLQHQSQQLPEWTWNGLDPPQQQALREVWCRHRHFAEVTAAGQLVMRVGRREVIA